MTLFKKKINKPIDSSTEEVGAVQLWVVSWVGRFGEFQSQTQKEFEAFASKDVAEDFANDLRQAFKLIKHTSQTEVTVKKS